jgi:Activator of Hsp90 ATPase homolog 1-like protein
MNVTQAELEKLTLNITQEIHVCAPLETTFEALIEQLGPRSEHSNGEPMLMKLEPWPGGRWYRDLGDGNGHFWAHVQAIKKPTLLELVGPLFMSYPVSSNVQYRLSEADGGTLIKFQHKAFGWIDEEHRKGVTTGWGGIHERLKKLAEGRGSFAAGRGRKQ